MFMLVKLKRL